MILPYHCCLTEKIQYWNRNVRKLVIVTYPFSILLRVICHISRHFFEEVCLRMKVLQNGHAATKKRESEKWRKENGWRQESCAIAKMTAQCADKVNKQPHFHLRSRYSRLTQFNRQSHVSVGLSVCSDGVLRQNGWLDLDAVLGGEWGWSRDGCIRCRWWSSKKKGQF